jgi:hypothetical protein
MIHDYYSPGCNLQSTSTVTPLAERDVFLERCSFGKELKKLITYL